MHVGGELGEVVEGGVDADEGELALDEGEVGTPDVGDDAAQVAGGVVPARARGAAATGAAAHGAQDDGLAGEQRGFVRREPDPADGRYTNAILSDEGWDKVVAAAPGHVAAVRHLVIDPLGPAQIAALGEIGEQLRTHVTGKCDGAAHTGPEC